MAAMAFRRNGDNDDNGHMDAVADVDEANDRAGPVLVPGRRSSLLAETDIELTEQSGWTSLYLL